MRPAHLSVAEAAVDLGVARTAGNRLEVAIAGVETVAGTQGAAT